MARARLGVECEELSDGEEELLKWKQAIRDQVEEDLEYQVQLRLRINPLYDYYKRHSAVTYPHLIKLKKSASITTQRSKRESKNECNPYQRHLLSEDNADAEHIVKDEMAIVGASEKPTDEITETHCTTKSDGCDGGNGGDADDDMNSDDAGAVDLCGVFNYVNTKYGVARTQLRKLTEKGCYDTVTVDTSGVGAGPNIRCPIESCILLPTPKLETQKPNPEIKSTCTANITTARHATTSVTSPSPSTSSPMHCIHRGKLVYKTGQETCLLPVGGLQFESRFECGNLSQAFQLTDQEYILWLAPDLYSERHTQWFYFRLKGMVTKKSYTFHIANFYKLDSLYNNGMQLLLYSKLSAEQSGNAWSRTGHTISYHKTNIKHIPPEMLGKSLYTLSWTMEFPYFDDTCYLAHCFPYSYSQLLSHLSKLEECPLASRYFSRETLCHTIAGNCCPLLTITNFEEPEEKPRMGIVITARVHPGETNSSWIMQGLIDFLISECAKAKNLRSRFVFKIVPMLNPDGVIVGNYRTSLAAVDLNRVYKSPRADLFPTIHSTKTMIKDFMEERELLLYVDLHGHSRKENVFMYGCHTPQCDHLQLLQERVLPFLLSQQAPQMFDFGSCKYSVQRCKEATGRVVTWKMGVPNSYTMESTFHGSTFADSKCHFSNEDLLSMGRKLAESIHYYYRYVESESYRHRVHSQIAAKMMAKLRNRSSESISRCMLPKIVANPEKQIKPKKTKTSSVSKNLTAFMQMDLKILEQESSTSGSDSEDDNFSWKGKVRSKRKATRGAQKNTTNDITLSVTGARQPKTRKLRNSTGTSYSAPARLCSNRDTTASKSTLPSSWTFVNKYQHRSNGGIPIFSEERLQERKEKRKLQSRSLILSKDPPANFKWLNSWKVNWPGKLEPIDHELPHKVDAQPHSAKVLTGNMMHLKLSPQLAKYISETWKAY